MKRNAGGAKGDGRVPMERSTKKLAGVARGRAKELFASSVWSSMVAGSISPLDSPVYTSGTRLANPSGSCEDRKDKSSMT